MAKVNRHLIFVLAAPLSLAACETEPAASPDAEEDAQAEQVEDVAEVEMVLPDAIMAMLTEEFSDFGNFSYRAGNADLNGDGQDEWLAFVTGPGVCGSGGCPLRIFDESGEAPRLIGSISVTQMPIGLFDSETDGWRDLAVTVGGGGIEYSLARVPWDGEAYASNPTVAPATPSEDEFTTVIALPEF